MFDLLGRGAAELTIDPEGWATVTTPDGLVLPGQRHGIIRAGPTPPMAA